MTKGKTKKPIIISEKQNTLTTKNKSKSNKRGNLLFIRKFKIKNKYFKSTLD